jgi:hypothetical protein
MPESVSPARGTPSWNAWPCRLICSGGNAKPSVVVELTGLMKSASFGCRDRASTVEPAGRMVDVDGAMPGSMGRGVREEGGS